MKGRGIKETNHIQPAGKKNNKTDDNTDDRRDQQQGKGDLALAHGDERPVDFVHQSDFFTEFFVIKGSNSVPTREQGCRNQEEKDGAINKLNQELAEKRCPK